MRKGNIGRALLGGKKAIPQYAWVLVVFVGLFLFGEPILYKIILLKQRDLSELELPTPFLMDKVASKPFLLRAPSMHEAIASKIVYFDEISIKNVNKTMFKTRLEQISNTKMPHYGVAPMLDVCVHPNGTLVVVGTSQEEMEQSVEAIGEEMVREWQDTYNCIWGCKGVQYVDNIPHDAVWIDGKTTHIIPYVNNVFHHFAERIWPHLTTAIPLDQLPKNHTTRYYVYNMHAWLEGAHQSMNHNTMMYQLYTLGLLSPQVQFLQHAEHETRLLCFEHLKPACASCGRMNTKLGSNVYVPALLRYRDATFSFFGIEEPQVVRPPTKLRVTYYGRGDTYRRRTINAFEVMHHLQKSWVQPPFHVTFVDAMLASGEYNQSLPEVVSLMSQTDILITTHGANTWASIFMPKHAAVIEIYGPCGPSTWIDVIVEALMLKHKTEENPWDFRVPSLLAGNTTECESADHTPDFTINITKLDEIIHSLALPKGVGDSFPLHWVYDWTSFDSHKVPNFKE